MVCFIEYLYLAYVLNHMWGCYSKTLTLVNDCNALALIYTFPLCTFRPFWLSPRQAVVIPVDPKYYDYADEVQQFIHMAGFYVDVDKSADTLNKKIRNGQIAQYNFILGMSPIQAHVYTCQ